METSLNFKINTRWDGSVTGHAPVEVTLYRQPGDTSLCVRVDAPFFGDPPAPDGEPGQPFDQLWDYEVVEVFLLNEKGKYLEVELCSHGQHLVLMLNGSRNMIKDQLPLQYTSSICGSQWQGIAQIPLAYLPPGVSKVNCYAIHGSGEERQYEALYPTPAGKFSQPDFHRLEYFQHINLNHLLAQEEVDQRSSYWT